jgi:flagellum-specific peptidoglycan hydrolase FlgJ
VNVDFFLEAALLAADMFYPIVIKGEKTKAEQDAFAQAMFTRGRIWTIRTGIPAALFAAQACLESGYGASPVAQEANNIFGIKSSHYHSGYQEKRRNCIKYDSIKDCIADYNRIVGTLPAYSGLKGGSLREWTFGIGPAGYTPDKGYGEALWNIMGIYGWR